MCIGVERHKRNPIRTRVTPLDSSDALYIVFSAYTFKLFSCLTMDQSGDMQRQMPGYENKGL